MIGDSLALASAFLFALANIAIAKAARKRSADNGVLLSIVATAALSTLILLLQPKRPLPESQAFFSAVGWFAASGILATVWGRLTLFKAVIQDIKYAEGDTAGHDNPMVEVTFQPDDFKLEAK